MPFLRQLQDLLSLSEGTVSRYLAVCVRAGYEIHTGVEWSVQCLMTESLARSVPPNLNRALCSSSLAIILSTQQLANTKECAMPGSIVCGSMSLNILTFGVAHNLQTHCSPQKHDIGISLLHTTGSGHMTGMMPAMSD